MSVWKNSPILTYKDFCSAFVTPKQRRDFLFNCAYAGLRSIRRAWPKHNIRMFVFGSAAKEPVRVGAGSDLDVAISGLRDIAPKAYQSEVLITQEFRKGLSLENRGLPIDVVTFDPDHPESTLAIEILRHGIEIKLE